jgi:hypothetical protein
MQRRQAGRLTENKAKHCETRTGFEEKGPRRMWIVRFTTSEQHRKPLRLNTLRGHPPIECKLREPHTLKNDRSHVVEFGVDGTMQHPVFNSKLVRNYADCA